MPGTTWITTRTILTKSNNESSHARGREKIYMLKPSRYRLVKALWALEWAEKHSPPHLGLGGALMCVLCNTVPPLITETGKSTTGTWTVQMPDPENVENHAPDCLYLELEKLPEKGATSYRDRRGRKLDHPPTELCN